MPLVPYILALCEAAQQLVPFGVVMQIKGQESSLKAPQLIKSLVLHSLASETVATEFLNKFHEVSCLRDLVAPVLNADTEVEADANLWAHSVVMALHGLTEHQISMELKPVLNLASDYLFHLILAVRNLGGKRTPQVSLCPSPNIVQPLAHIMKLTRESKQNQGALKRLVIARDGPQCIVTGYSFNSESEDYVKPHCAHIVPICIHKKHTSLCLIESFTGRQLSTKYVIENINHPRNVFNVQRDAHDYFDELEWGIEATVVNGKTKYYFRRVGPVRCATINLQDGDEVAFKCGLNGEVIDGPDPGFCNLKLAIARVLHACGAAEIIRKLYVDDDDDDDDDDDEFTEQPTYFGGPFVSDEELCHEIQEKLAP